MRDEATHRRRHVGNSARSFRTLLAVFGIAALGSLVSVVGADVPLDADALVRRETELARQYADLERSFLRLADILATTDPRRAAVLRDAFDQAREIDVNVRLNQIVTLLEAGQLLKAGASQEGAIEQFRGLLSLLEADNGDRGLTDTKKEVQAFLGRVTKLIARQRDVEGSTEGGGNPAEIAARQGTIADDAAELAGELEGFATRNEDKPEAQQDPKGKPPRDPSDVAPSKPEDAGSKPGPSKAPGEGQPDGLDAEPPEAQPQPPTPGKRSDAGESEGEASGKPSGTGSEEDALGNDESARARRARKRLQEAEKRMREARRKLDDADRRGARGDQEKAIQDLETARAELEEILRQLREEEVERLLVQLETRVRLMLRSERAILSAIEAVTANTEMSSRERQIEAARIGREQEEVTSEASRALTLVRDDGSAVAVPEALRQIHDDCVQASAKLGRGGLDGETTGLVKDIVAGLHELLAALEKSRQDQDKQQQEGKAQGRAAEPGEQPLVDKIAELKMLRSLQLRVNTRTQRYSQLLDEGAERATEPEIVDALARLAERQRAIEKAARDIVTGRTE